MMNKDVFKVCEYCGETYRINVPHQKFCCKSCSESYRLEYKEQKDAAAYSIFERDNFTCCYCGKSSIEHNALLVVEHIIPRCNGGNNSIYNTVTSCVDCNARKNVYMLSRSVFMRILRRNIKRNKGISAKKRAEIRAGLMIRFNECDQNESMLSYGAF